VALRHAAGKVEPNFAAHLVHSVMPAARRPRHRGDHGERPSAPVPRGDPSADAARLLRPAVSWTFLAVTASLAVVYGAGLLNQAVYSVILVGTCVGIATGIRRNRPARPWNWWGLIAAALLWTVAAVIRDSVHATGVLTSARSLVPDLFAIPGYLIMASSLRGLVRSRQTGARDRNAWLDGAVVSLGALLLAWVFALRPTLSDTTAWLPAQLSVAVYPPLSALLVTFALRLAFGSDRRSASHQMVFVGTVLMLTGDIAFAMEEVGTLSVARVYELPFMLASALFGAAALHPSMRYLSRRSTKRNGRLTNTRIVVLGVALLLPAVVAIAVPAATTAAKWFLGVNLCALAATAAARLLFTVREQSQSEERLVYQATHDELTGLPNRTLAVEHIEHRLRQNELTGATLAVMFADVDQFKLINDSMGHAVGDELLVVAARRLLAAVRGADMVARISGDEFLIVCDQVDLRTARQLAERVRMAFNEHFDLSAGRIFATTSIGIAITEKGVPTDAAALVRDADTAMYRSKVSGRDAITFFDVKMRQQVERRVALERLMRTALERGEIVPYFQPVVTLPAGHVGGFEALARWPRPAGQILPKEFIPVAEESGLIVALGATILDQACRQVAEWRRTLPDAADIYVSVNLSPRQILESDIVDTVAHTLERYGLPGSALWLEITESVMMEDTIETRAILNALCDLGVLLSVDDFGTGFSSLSYLRKYPISRVKIDKSFVDGLDEVGADQSLVVAIIAMARALNLGTVAEGVERSTQATGLFELGCSDAQGYYFGRALPAAEVHEAVLPLGFATNRTAPAPAPAPRQATG
jgi:diguanylate cyclase (GGDEF)-like protein